MQIRIDIRLDVRGWFTSRAGDIEHRSEIAELLTTAEQMIPIGHLCHAGHQLDVDDGVITLDVRFLDLVGHGPLRLRGSIEWLRFRFEQYKSKRVFIKHVDLAVIPSDEDLRRLQREYRP